MAKIRFFLVIAAMAIFLCGSFAQAGFFDDGMRYYLGVGAGTQWLNTSQSQVSKNGFLLYGGFSAEKHVPSLGFFDLGLGIEHVNQTISLTNPIVDLGWSHPVFFKGFEAGVLTRSLIGQGSYFDFSGSNSVEWLFSVGPRLRYRWGMSGKIDLILSTGLLVGLTSPNRTTWELPIELKITLPFGNESPALVYIPINTPIHLPEIATARVPVPFRAAAAVPFGGAYVVPAATLPSPTARLVGDIEPGEVAQAVPPDIVKVTLPVSRVSFDVAEARLDARGRAYLEYLGSILGDRSVRYFELDLSGHTDNRGSDLVNNRISKERAEAVARALKDQGVDASRIATFGLGSSRPIDRRKTEEAYRRNRRVEILVNGIEVPITLAKRINEMDRRFNVASP